MQETPINTGPQALQEQLACISDPLVQQLAQACFGPLVYDSLRRTGQATCYSDNSSSHFDLTGSRWQQLQALNSDPSPLIEFLSDKPGTGRLGIYFEHLFEYFLVNDPAIELLSRNMAVRDNGHTLGEFDFIYNDTNTNERVHHELAIKFYMGFEAELNEELNEELNKEPTPTQTLPGRWLGPAVHDSFEQKLDKLENKQSRLSQSPQAKQALKQANVPSPTLFRNSVSGQLYYPFDKALFLKGLAHDIMPSSPFLAPEHCTKRHLHGLWVHLNDLYLTKPQSQTISFLPRGKRQWLTPLAQGTTLEQSTISYDTTGNLRPLSDTALGMDALLTFSQDIFKQHGRPFMVELFDQISQTALGIRMFIAPDLWPYLGRNH